MKEATILIWVTFSEMDMLLTLLAKVKSIDEIPYLKWKALFKRLEEIARVNNVHTWKREKNKEISK